MRTFIVTIQKRYYSIRSLLQSLINPVLIRLNLKKNRVKTPTILQMEAVECGAASLAIIMARYGKFIPLEELRIECGVSRDGSKANNMMKAGKKYGFIVRGFKMEPKDVRKVQMPAIVHWNFNHFVVLEGFHKGQVYLNDPAKGPRIVSEDEFDESFTGIILTFEPGPEFTIGGVKPNIWRSLKSRLQGSETALVYIVLISLMLVIPGLIIPIFSKIFVDEYLVKQMDDWLRPLLLAMGITAVLRGGLTWLQQFYLLRMETKFTLSTSSKFLWHVFKLPIEFFSQRYGGEITSRVLINDRVAQLLSGELATTILNLIVLVFYAAIMFYYDVVLTLVGIGISVLNVVALKYFSRKRVDENQKLLQEKGKLLGVAMNGLQMIETLKASGSESDFFSRWAGYQAKMLNAQQKLGMYTHVLITIPPTLTMINTAVILALGSLRVMDGHLSMGMLVAFQSLMVSFTGPVAKMVKLGSVLQDAEGDMNRLDDVLRYKTDEQFKTEDTNEVDEELIKLSGVVELENVTFGYSRLEKPLIENFSLKVNPGARVALVGGSGSGKSTIAKLVAGLYKPWAGDIRFDGIPRNDIPRNVINNSLGMVDQDIFLFDGMIRDNLTLWDSTVPKSGIIQAAKDACIHDDVTGKPGGYEGTVDEGGTNFSGGQRQRLEIARALMNNPTIMILDEATSALDPITEKVIDDNLRRRGCTCLIVAHRLSTIRDCDEIIVLDRGQVVQRGTHDELKKIDGPYASLIEN
ncbi:NHLP family bacteriocin export ABC transporter peptidase/permease/ATPase subunit [candidate division KSB1 bacterium]|nr:NHLP family bacteriocin export ABC transporter peptidase/permease/ATPase subunit [candidate division KSB1 bacterium]